MKIRVSACLSWEAEHEALEMEAVKAVTIVSPELPQNERDAYRQG